MKYVSKTQWSVYGSFWQLPRNSLPIQLNQEAYIDKASDFNTLYLIEINDEMELGPQETYNSLCGIAHQELKG